MSQVPPSHCIRLIVKTKKTRPYPLDVATAPPLSFQKKRIYSSRTWSDGFFYIPRVCTSTNIFKFVFGLLNQTRIRLWSSQNQNRIPFWSSQPTPAEGSAVFHLVVVYTYPCSLLHPPVRLYFSTLGPAAATAPRRLFRRSLPSSPGARSSSSRILAVAAPDEIRLLSSDVIRSPGGRPSIHTPTKAALKSSV